MTQTVSTQQGSKQTADKNAIRPFPVASVPEAELTDLSKRINATRWRFLRDRVERMRRESGIAGQKLEIVEIPQRAIGVKLHGTPGAFVQASVSLAGDRIEIRTQDNTEFGAFVNQEPDVIRIEYRGDRAVFIHNDERTVDPDEVAGIILAPILDYYRSAA